MIEGDVPNRLARQSVLSCEEPPLVWTQIDEGVLYRPVAPTMEGSGSAVIWRTSSYSGNNGGNCVEVTDAASVVMVRDTNDRDGRTLAFTAEAWASFTGSLRSPTGT